MHRPCPSSHVKNATPHQSPSASRAILPISQPTRQSSNQPRKPQVNSPNHQHTKVNSPNHQHTNEHTDQQSGKQTDKQTDKQTGSKTNCNELDVSGARVFRPNKKHDQQSQSNKRPTNKPRSEHIVDLRAVIVCVRSVHSVSFTGSVVSAWQSHCARSSQAVPCSSPKCACQVWSRRRLLLFSFSGLRSRGFQVWHVAWCFLLWSVWWPSIGCLRLFSSVRFSCRCFPLSP